MKNKNDIRTPHRDAGRPRPGTSFPDDMRQGKGGYRNDASAKPPGQINSKDEQEYVRQYVMPQTRRSKWAQEYVGIEDVSIDAANVFSSPADKDKPRRRPSDENKERRRKAKIMLIVLGILLAVVLAYPIVSLFRDRLVINDVWVEGDSPYTAEELMSAAGMKLGDGLYAQSKSQAATKILENLPYLNTCSISIELPDKLVIKVTSSTATMYTKIAGEYYALSPSLRVLERSDTPDKFKAKGLVFTDLPRTSRAVVGSDLVLAGGKDSEYIVNFIKTIDASPLAGKITRLFLDDKFDIVATVSGAYRIKFGSNGDAVLKVMAAARIIESDDFGNKGAAVIDVTVPTLACARYEQNFDPDSRG